MGGLLGTSDGDRGEVESALLDLGRPREDVEAALRRKGREDGVARDCREIGGSACRLFGDSGGRGALRFGHWIVASGLDGLLVVVLELHGRQADAHMPFDVVGEHLQIQKHVGADAIGEPVMYRTKVKVDGFDATKSPLHHAQGFISAHGRGVPNGFGRKTRGHRANAVRGAVINRGEGKKSPRPWSSWPPREASVRQNLPEAEQQRWRTPSFAMLNQIAVDSGTGTESCSRGFGISGFRTARIPGRIATKFANYYMLYFRGGIPVRVSLIVDRALDVTALFPGG